MVPFEIALVSSYTPSIVTFHLSLRLSEIPGIAAFVLQHATFPYPTASLPKIFPYSPGSRWMAFGPRRAKMLGSLSVQLVFKISNLWWSWSTNVTDGQTTCNFTTALCSIVHRAVKTISIFHRLRPVKGYVVDGRPCFLQSVSIACYAERCISYRKSVRLSVCLSVRHTLALSQNDSSYDHGVFTGR